MSVLTAARLGPWLVGVTVAVTFVLALGGFHPSNAEKDREVLVAAAIVALASVPSAWLLGERLLRRAPAAQSLGAAFWLLLPALAAAWVLRFVASVDMTPRLRLDEFTSAEVVEQVLSNRLPPGTTLAEVQAFGASHRMECSGVIEGVVDCSAEAPAEAPLVRARWLVRFTFAEGGLVKVEVRKGLIGP